MPRMRGPHPAGLLNLLIGFRWSSRENSFVSQLLDAFVIQDHFGTDDDDGREDFDIVDFGEVGKLRIQLFLDPIVEASVYLGLFVAADSVNECRDIVFVTFE